MLRFFSYLVPQICFHIDEPAGGPAPVEAPPAGGEPAPEPTPELVASEGTDTPPTDVKPTWPGREEVLKKMQDAKKPVEEPKPAEPTTPEPPKKEYVDPSKPLLDIIEGLDAKEFEGKTVKDFQDYLSKVEGMAKELEAVKGIKEFLEKNKIDDKDLASLVKSKMETPAEPQKELSKEDFDTEEEYQDAVKKAEAERANEERLRKLEEQAQAERNEKFNQKINDTVADAIKRHTDEETQKSILTNEDINLAFSLLKHIPDDVDVDIPAIMTQTYDLIAEQKKAFAKEAVKFALEKAKPETIKEYLAMNAENQKKTLEAMGQTPAPDFAKPEEPLTGKDFESGRLKARAMQFVKEALGKK